FRDFDHRDVSDDIEGTREGGPNGLGNLDDISVAPDCGEPLREVLLRGGESHFDLPSDREQNGLTFRRDSEMLLYEVPVEESATDVFRAFARDDARPRSHRPDDEPG